MSDYDHSIHTNPDAAAWAKFFAEHYPEGAPTPDEDTMLTWFANAMMAMYDHIKTASPGAEEEALPDVVVDAVREFNLSFDRDPYLSTVGVRNRARAALAIVNARAAPDSKDDGRTG